MLSYEEMEAIVSKCKYKDWSIVLDKDKVYGERPYIQVQFMEVDRYTGELSKQMCRKWYLSNNMMASEVVRTAHKAVRTAMEHEVDEAFEYDDVRLFNPHFDLQFLVDFAKKRKVDIR